MIAEGQFIDSNLDRFEKVSFVIPAHNEADFIRPTILAIHDAAKVCEIEYEILVINDDSTDRTPELARESGAKVTNVKLRNIGAVRNAGAREANHPWLFFIDADTTLPAKTLRGALTALANGSAGGGARVVIDETQPLFWLKRVMYLCVVMIWQVIGGWAAGCFMYCRKDVFESFGGFNEKFFAAEELFFSRAVKRCGRFHLVRSPVHTSARKLHRYSTWELVRFVTSPLLNFWSPLRSRKGLDILYQDDR